MNLLALFVLVSSFLVSFSLAVPVSSMLTEVAAGDEPTPVEFTGVVFEGRDTTANVMEAQGAQLLPINLYDDPYYKGHYYYVNTSEPNNICYTLKPDFGISSIKLFNAQQNNFNCYVYPVETCARDGVRVTSSVYDLRQVYNGAWNDKIRSYLCAWW